jgi:hypothetical protein
MWHRGEVAASIQRGSVVIYIIFLLDAIEIVNVRAFFALCNTEPRVIGSAVIDAERRKRCGWYGDIKPGSNGLYFGIGCRSSRGCFAVREENVIVD